MFLDGRGTPSAGRRPARALPATDRLDVSRLQDLVLTPLLGIGDVRPTSASISSAALRGTGELETLRAIGPGGGGVFDVSRSACDD